MNHMTCVGFSKLVPSFEAPKKQYISTDLRAVQHLLIGRLELRVGAEKKSVLQIFNVYSKRSATKSILSFFLIE